MERIKGLQMYNFLLSPARGMMKTVAKFNIGREQKADGEEKEYDYYLLPKNMQAKENNEGRISIEKVPSPITKENKVMFLVQALIIPIFFALLAFFVGAKNIFYFSPGIQLIVGGSFLLTVSYFVHSLKQIRDFTHGVKEATKNDMKVLFVSVFVFIGVGVASMKITGPMYAEISSLLLNGIWFMMFIELIKKPALIILSDKVQYWEYSNESGEIDFLLITSKKKDAEI